MIMKYHNHKLQPNPWNREEEPHNNHETPGRQTKHSNQLALPHRDDCKTSNACKKYRTITESHTGSNNQQHNHRLRTDISQSHWSGGGGFNAFYWYQIFALDTAVVEAQNMLHTGQCKRTGGCYNELMVAFLRTGDGLKGKKIYTC